MKQNGHATDMYKQLEKAFEQIDSLSKKLIELESENRKKVKKLNYQIKALENTNRAKDKKIEKLELEIKQIKAKNNRDSSNSSKPSSTNGFRKVITNRREPSNRKQGGQAGHQFYSLTEDKIDELIASGVKPEIIEIGKTPENQNRPYKTIKVIDIIVKPVIKEYRYYGECIKEVSNIQNIIYGNTIKAFSSMLMYQFPNSTDATKEIIKSLTNDCIDISKGTLINWGNNLSEKLQPEIRKIEEELLRGHYLHHDESGWKINGTSSNLLVASNATHSRFWNSKRKRKKDIEEIGFLSRFNGIIIKDATDIYNGCGSGFSQCLSHILRYLKGIYEINKHQSPRLMSEFLINCIDNRNKLISEDIKGYSVEEYEKLLLEYEQIIKSWKKEWMASFEINPIYDDERQLLSRMEDNDKKQILYFLQDFKVPATNNQAESDLRPSKIKQKIGKFRSAVGADNYVIIRSCVNTYKKNNINILEAFTRAFGSKPILV